MAPAPITPAPPAWQNTAQPTVISTQADGPNPNKKDDASTVSTLTTASLTTQHTSDAILLMQQTLDQAVHTKLDSVDKCIQSALSSFRFELSNTLAVHVQEVKNELQGMIVTQQTHVVQIALAALTSTSSQYVTNDQLQTQFSKLLDGLDQRLSTFEHSSPASPDRNERKMTKT
jgi:hypothetical protein